MKTLRKEWTCIFCKEKEVELVPEYFPWSDKHYACPLCDSTYSVDKYPLIEDETTADS